MNKIDKRQLFLGLAVVVSGSLAAIGFFALANSKPSHFKINGFQMIRDVAVSTFEWTWGFVKLFASLFWNIISTSWLSALVFIVLVAFIILKYIYERKYR